MKPNTQRRVIRCRSCDRLSTYQDHPDDGWYQLSVNDSSQARGYRYLGLFCSIACLTAHMPEMTRVESDMTVKGRR
jgi:hypothetical protein